MGRIALTSPLQKHRDRWKRGCGNTICQNATRVCLVRGTIPCDILFIGEAPGESENIIGSPFVGPAGKFLDRLVVQGLDDVVPNGRGGIRRLVWAFTNLLGCIPRDTEGKIADPDPDEIKRCQPRLVELVRLCRPRAIVNVGTIPKKYVYGQTMFGRVDWLPGSQEFIVFADIVHPAAILRAPTVNQGLMAQRVVNQLRGLLIDLGGK